MNRHHESLENDDAMLRLDARDVAPLLGLTPERLMAELRAGRIYHVAEEAADRRAGLLRVTFRYRTRVARLIVGTDGSARLESSQTN